MANVFTEKMRTSVLYDFSIVTKAMFYITEPLKGDDFNFIGEYENYEIRERLPVQVNPNKISGSAGTARTYAYGSTMKSLKKG